MRYRASVRAFSLLLATCLIIGGVAWSQSPILKFTVSPDEVSLLPGGTAAIELNIDNGSVYQADDIAVSLSATDGITLDPAEMSVLELAPFAANTVAANLAASSSLPEGRYGVSLDVIYTYCIDVSCFQIVEQIPLTVNVGETAAAAPAAARVHLPPWLLPGAGAVLIGLGLGLWRFRDQRLPLYVILIVLVVVGLAYGVSRGQHEQAQEIAAVLCTSCVGIESAEPGTPSLTPAGLAALGEVTSDINLIVFFAPWCHTCPYAEAMVEQMAVANEHIRYQFIDVSTQRDLAVDNGVVRSNRTIVPAIVRTDTGEVIFGIEDLESRLLQMLGVGT